MEVAEKSAVRWVPESVWSTVAQNIKQKYYIKPLARLTAPHAPLCCCIATSFDSMLMILYVSRRGGVAHIVHLHVALSYSRQWFLFASLCSLARLPISCRVRFQCVHIDTRVLAAGSVQSQRRQPMELTTPPLHEMPSGF